MTSTIRQYRHIALIADTRRRDMASERDWIVAIVTAALIFGIVLVGSTWQ